MECNRCGERLPDFDVAHACPIQFSHPTPVQGEALPVVENDDADSAMHGACDPKYWQRATLEWKKIVRELNEKAIALGFESARQCIDAMPVFERALSLQETHLDKHVATINELRTQLSDTTKLREALKRISCESQTDGLLWWQLEARAALNSTAQENE